MRLTVLIGALGLAALGGCQTVQTTAGGAVGVERKQSMSTLISSGEMDASAAKAYSDILVEARKKDRLNRDRCRPSACARLPID
jgi:hypothetical protein